jgi:hypothetical protein
MSAPSESVSAGYAWRRLACHHKDSRRCPIAARLITGEVIRCAEIAEERDFPWGIGKLAQKGVEGGEVVGFGAGRVFFERGGKGRVLPRGKGHCLIRDERAGKDVAILEFLGGGWWDYPKGSRRSEGWETRIPDDM